MINACCVKFKFKILYKSINFWLISSLIERRPGDSSLSCRVPGLDSRRKHCVCPRGVLSQGGENFGKVPQYSGDPDVMMSLFTSFLFRGP